MTHRFVSYISALLLCFAAFLPAAAQERYIPLPPSLDGSMMPYDFKSCTQTPYLPDSLTPVYAAYVARHGARYLSGPKKMEVVMAALDKGRNTGTLSTTGEAFLSLMEQVRAANTGNWGDLSPVGVSEQRNLGSRVFHTLTRLSRPDTRVNAISSHVSRVVMTMYQFTNTLIRNNDLLSTTTDAGPQFDSLLCCFIADREYADYRSSRGNWRPVYDDFVSRHVSPQPARRLFTSTDLDDSQLRKLTLEMYEVLKGDLAAGLPAPTTRWMSEQEYHGCWLASNLQHYLRNCITPLSSLAGQATVPLLRRIISDADSALGHLSPSPAINGYFGHCETLLPLLSLLRLPGCYYDSSDFRDLDKSWRIQDISPLGANLLILFTQAPSGRHYVTLQLNGRTVRPITGQPDIVAWSDLRDYWLSLAHQFSR